MKKQFLLLVLCGILVSASICAQQRNILIEKYSATWCGYCPAAALVLDSLIEEDNRVVGVSIHHMDVMAVSEGSEVTSAFVEQFPGSTMDRFKFPEEEKINVFYQDWRSYLDDRLNTPSFVNVYGEMLDYNESTNEITVNVSVDFVADFTGDLRLNCYVLEDKVTGGSSYNQRNYYFNNDPSHPLYQKGDPMVGYEHNHVLRKMAGGAWGTIGVVPNNVSNGVTYGKEYTFVVENDWDVNNLKFVAVAQHYDNDIHQRNIENVYMFDMNGPDGVASNVHAKLDLQVFPNPSGGLFVVKGQNVANTINDFVVMDLFGEHIKAEMKVVDKDIVNIYLSNDVANGLYLLQHKNDETTTIIRLIKN